MRGIPVGPGVKNNERDMCRWSWKMWLPHSIQLGVMISTWECISRWFNVNIQAWSYLRYQALERAVEWRKFYEKEKKKWKECTIA